MVSAESSLVNSCKTSLCNHGSLVVDKRCLDRVRLQGPGSRDLFHPIMSDSPPPPDLATENYDVMLEQLDKAIGEIVEKVESGRIRNPEHEKVRIKYYRALGYLIRTKRKVLEDKTLEDLEAEIQELKTANENGAVGVDTEA